MTDLPNRIDIVEEGPREGFQIEAGPISTAAKIELIDALSSTGAQKIQIASFVSPKAVPGWADADEVVSGFSPRHGVEYTAIWFNERGMDRAVAHKGKLSNSAAISLSASEAFSERNLRRDLQGQRAAMVEYVRAHMAAGVPVERVIVMASFGCNFSGRVSTDAVLTAVADGLAIADDNGARIQTVTLADSMGWCSPSAVRRLVDAVRERWPDMSFALHLHDTRGQGIAAAYEGIRLGISKFDSAVAGLGGCPFAGQPGAPGNIATEELVLLAQEMGIETGINLEAMIETARLAERIVGHPLPSALLRSGSLKAFLKDN
ncbi:hydroxymethylglutaryl-CoA lyase [Rhizobium puerariae]|uniref:Hydroxymethylglutaryl-CoA lyase n=1 Tax=Rhizobium puerariae TaxID=1585791 RepID=A0ABV6AIS1_9HYPH